MPKSGVRVRCVTGAVDTRSSNRGLADGSPGGTTADPSAVDHLYHTYRSALIPMIEANQLAMKICASSPKS